MHSGSHAWQEIASQAKLAGRTEIVGGCTSSGFSKRCCGGNEMKPLPTTFGFCTKRKGERGAAGGEQVKVADTAGKACNLE